MRSVMIAAMLATVGSLAFAEYDADVIVVASENGVVSYADLHVPMYLEPVFSWPPGSFYDCGTCSQEGCEPKMIWETTMKGTPSSLAATVDRLGEVVAYNASRNALQVRGCQGSIIMSIPLSQTQVGALDL